MPSAGLCRLGVGAGGLWATRALVPAGVPNSVSQDRLAAAKGSAIPLPAVGPRKRSAHPVRKARPGIFIPGIATSNRRDLGAAQMLPDTEINEPAAVPSQQNWAGQGSCSTMILFNTVKLEHDAGRHYSVFLF